VIRRLLRWWLFGSLGVLVALYLVADVAARRYATTQMEKRISAAVPEAQGVHGRIRSFPFLIKLVANGSVGEVGARLDRVVSGVLIFVDLDVDLRGVVLDKSELINHRKVRVTRIDRGTVTVDVTAADLSRALGRQVSIDPSGVFVGGAAAGAQRVAVSVGSGRQFVLTVGGAVVRATLPSDKVLPCLPGVQFAPGRVQLSCTFTEIPPALSSPG